MKRSPSPKRRRLERSLASLPTDLVHHVSTFLGPKEVARLWPLLFHHHPSPWPTWLSECNVSLYVRRPHALKGLRDLIQLAHQLQAVVLHTDIADRAWGAIRTEYPFIICNHHEDGGKVHTPLLGLWLGKSRAPWVESKMAMQWFAVCTRMELPTVLRRICRKSNATTLIRALKFPLLSGNAATAEVMFQHLGTKEPPPDAASRWLFDDVSWSPPGKQRRWAYEWLRDHHVVVDCINTRFWSKTAVSLLCEVFGRSLVGCNHAFCGGMNIRYV